MSKYTSLEFFLGVLLLVGTVSLIYPYGFPLFTIVAILYFFVFFINKKVKIKFNFGFGILYIMITLYFLGILISANKLYPYNIADIQSIVVLIILFMLMGNANYITLKKVTTIYLNFCSIIIPILAIYSLYKYALLLNGVKISKFLIEGRNYPWGTSLMPDYNMFALGMLIGLLATISKLSESESVYKQVFYLFATVLIVLAVIFSGSRRGWILLAISSVYLIYILLRKIFRSSLKSKITFILTLTLSVVIGIVILSKSSLEITNQYELEKLQYRYSTLENLGESLSSRTSMWDYTLEIIRDYSVLNYIIGDGFNYIEQYGKKFNNPNGYTYPHNILISTFHYSGGVGVILLLVLLVKPYILYINNKSLIPSNLILMYTLCLLFLLVSGNSFFSINILWLTVTIIIVGIQRREIDKNEESYIHCSK
ncbi:O-antigen ligase family protein [Sporosarcina jiandibaonis]|uniref:O-antigen ligase family protein n=1 Tax=Sporosarcina jiandibaonis TaxID=2715535 RepID=UPI0015530EC1|nr:O-antigen ligase family protein [Sporosarcina jiandibaonis]